MVTKEEIEAAKSVDLRDIAEGLNVPMQRARDHVKICCPFHAEDTPSMAIYEDHYFCYGCNEKGDVIDFVKKFYEVGFEEAVKALIGKK